MIKHRKALRDTPCRACTRTISKGDMYFRRTSDKSCFCEKCFSTGSSDYLMWVGARYYPTIEEFVKEAVEMGVCKRVPKLPSDFRPGVSRVFLAHDEGKRPTEEEKDAGILSYGVIFGFFPIMKIRLVLDDPEKIAEYQEKLRGVPLEILSTAEAAELPERGCGTLMVGATYLITEKSMDEAWELAKPLAARVEVQGGIVTFKEQIPVLHIQRFRGIKNLEKGLIPPLDELGLKIGRQVEPGREISTEGRS